MKRIFIFFLILSGQSLTCIAEQSGNRIILSQKEKQWIKEHPVIRVANEWDWPPFDFNEAGTPKGMAIDYIELLAKKIGIKIKFVYGHSWSELIALFKQRKIDVMPVFYVTEARKDFTLYTKPYHRAKLGIFTNSDNKAWDNTLLNKQIGIEKQHGAIPIIKKRIKGIQFVEFDNKVQLVRALATKKIDAIIGNPLVFYHHAKESQITNLQLVDYIELSYEEQLKTSLHIGVRKDWPILHQLLQKAMQATNEEELMQIKNRWTSVTFIQRIDWGFIAKVSGVIILIILFLLYNNRRLHSLVMIQTKNLKELNENLETEVDLRTTELLEANKELENLNRAKNKFFSIVSHDLRSPISNIITICGLATCEDNTHKQKELIPLIYDSAKTTHSLLENLLKWATSESGQLTPSPIAIDIGDLVKEVILFFPHIASRKNLQLKNAINGTYNAFADYDMTTTVLRNLISNATKFTPDNGCIEIRASRKNDMIEITVKDNGIGIDPQEQPKIFDIDCHYSTLGTRAETGAGIGLKLCNEFVTKNGGRIWVSSTLNQGSAFTFSLPAATKENNIS